MWIDFSFVLTMYIYLYWTWLLMLLSVMINVENPFHPAHILPKFSSALLTQALSTVSDLCFPRCEVRLDLLLQTHRLWFWRTALWGLPLPGPHLQTLLPLSTKNKNNMFVTWLEILKETAFCPMLCSWVSSSFIANKVLTASSLCVCVIIVSKQDSENQLSEC